MNEELSLTGDLIPELFLTIKAGKVSCFYPLLQRGFMVKAEIGRSIKTFLSTYLEVTPEYIDERIKTIFLDGKAVDDIDTTSLRDRSNLALSAAMPGLVGATLRREGHLAPMRNQITCSHAEMPPSIREGIVSLKLFNLLLKDHGTALLKKGVIVRKSELVDLLRSLSNEQWERFKTVTVDGREVEPVGLLYLKLFRESNKHKEHDLIALRIDLDD